MTDAGHDPDVPADLAALRPVPLPMAAIRPRAGTQAMFRFRPIRNHVLVTNVDGRWLLLSRDEFTAFARGEVPEGSPLHDRLSSHGFLREGYRVPQAVERLRARRSFLQAGPNLHMLVVTLRCNETCAYCHASRANMDAVHTDMSKETARKAVDLALASTSPFVTLEFQGGEPLVNYEVVQEVVDYATRQNRERGKQLEFTMVSNFSLLDDAKLDWLIEHRVQLCTSVDGPQALHNAQRRLPTGDAHQKTVFWIRRINERYQQLGLDPTLYHVEALLTTTRATLPMWKEVVDTYVELGCRSLFLRPIDPFGFAERTARRLEYPRHEYLEYYRRAVDYMLELNARGVEILERYAAIFLTKILGGHDPNFLDLRSPAGAGIGALAYDYDGSIYTCDEGRMLAAAGDQSFRLGHVDTARYRELVGHPTVRALAIATNLDAQPDCVHCTYQPYCGTNAAYNHKTQGSIFGRMRDNAVCAVHKGIQDYLFEKLDEGDPSVLRTFERWTTIRAREHFVQPLSDASSPSSPAPADPVTPRGGPA
ncbi:His-Xaa-Ser system radical SAM maturase HxsB [Paraliomyxa miuraensis]|uniref:His-Xaa-Ser system radical SAM maturase HxsB n=1 Tax=Paraliomyxa miuraensis TaxID=376150 RepID=UPI002253A257|nr:His-Xaa-Ser system radical SAM maturase HxsB [Paraliomyxa miuraensis]MCX4239804.1 His-Xaa-Ser system radical SAM maturase HxsB [Paraliomyxa miuraensis]